MDINPDVKNSLRFTTVIKQFPLSPLHVYQRPLSPSLFLQITAERAGEESHNPAGVFIPKKNSLKEKENSFLNKYPKKNISFGSTVREKV